MGRHFNPYRPREEMVCFQLFRHHTFKDKHSARAQNLSPGTNSSLRYAIYQDSCSPEAIYSSSQADFTPPHSPHSVEVIIGRHVVFIIASQTQLVPITLVDKVPELLWTQRLKEGRENSTHFHLRIPKSNEFGNYHCQQYYSPCSESRRERW